MPPQGVPGAIAHGQVTVPVVSGAIPVEALDTLGHFIIAQCVRDSEKPIAEAYSSCWRAIMPDLSRMSEEWQVFQVRPIRDTGLQAGSQKPVDANWEGEEGTG